MILLRKLIRQIISEAKENSNTITIEKSDLDTVLLESNVSFYTPKGLQVYAPYINVDDWKPSHLKNDSLKPIIENGGSPFQLVDTIKKDILIQKKQKKGTTQFPVKTLTMSPGDKKYFENLMAQKIAGKFKGEHYNISFVTYADSSSNMAKNIATDVANFLNVPLVDVFKKNTDIEKIGINEPRFEKYSKDSGKDKDSLEKFRNQLNANLRTMRRKFEKGEKVSIAKDVMVNRREFFRGIHDIVPGSLDDKSGNILVIDDNLDSGSTFIDMTYQLEDYLKNFRGKVYFAVGFRMNRKKYKDLFKKSQEGKRFVEKINFLYAKKHNIKIILPREKARVEEIDFEEKIESLKEDLIPYSVLSDKEYKVDDIIKYEEYGDDENDDLNDKIGIVEEIKPSSIMVNFYGKIVYLPYLKGKKEQQELKRKEEELKQEKDDKGIVKYSPTIPYDYKVGQYLNYNGEIVKVINVTPKHNEIQVIFEPYKEEPIGASKRLKLKYKPEPIKIGSLASQPIGREPKKSSIEEQILFRVLKRINNYS